MKIGIAVVLLIAIFVSLVYAAEKVGRDQIVKIVNSRCPQCHFKLQAVRIDLLSGAGELKNFSFTVPGKPEIGVKVGGLRFVPELSSLFSDTKVFSEVDLDTLEVSLISLHTKKEERKPSPPELDEVEEGYGGEFLEALPEVQVKQIQLHHSLFAYMEKVGEEKAKLQVSEIEASISALGTRKELSPRFTDVNLTGKFQQSGEVLIKIKADLFSVENEDELSISVKNQSMPDLDEFFVLDEGLSFKGQVSEVATHVTLRQGRLNGEVAAHYKDLEVTAVQGPEHSKFAAAVINFVEKMKVAKSKPGPNEPAPVGQVAYKRQPGESIIMFILNGLKEGAFKAIDAK